VETSTERRGFGLGLIQLASTALRSAITYVRTVFTSGELDTVCAQPVAFNRTPGIYTAGLLTCQVMARGVTRRTRGPVGRCSSGADRRLMFTRGDGGRLA
jgi:hypothetical protein